MSKQLSFKFNFISFGLLLILLVLANFSEAYAQEVTPTPTPTVENKENLPTVDDTQNVKPENLEGVPQIAPNYQSDDKTLPELGRVGVDMMLQKPLTLREAIVLALDNNKDIEVTRKNVRISEFDLQSARGAYQPRFNAQSFYERATTPTASFFSGSTNGSTTQSNFTGNARFEGLAPNGGSYKVEFNNSRINTNNLFATLNPQYASNLNFQYSQPLFRGRTFDQNRRQVEIAKKNLSLTDAQFRQRTVEIIASVQRGYWDLTFALRNLQVQRDGVRDAKDQLAHNRRLVEEGQLAPVDIIASETQVANFEQNVYDALNTVTIAENALKNLIAENRKDTIWNESIVPVDPIDLDAPATSLPEALEAALQNRPELDVSETTKEINRIDQRFFREQARPQVDLVANYNLAGLAGTANTNANPFSNDSTRQKINELVGRVNTLNPTFPPIGIIPAPLPQTLPDNLIGGYFGSLGNLAAFRYPTFRVGVSISLPFKSETAQAQLGRSLVEGERIQTQREQLEQNIQVDVRNALQFVRTAEARLRSAAISRENSQKQYESEQRKLDAGQSDVYKVLERQTALTTARSNELRAQTELNKAISELQRATGNSLKANNVETRLRK